MQKHPELTLQRLKKAIDSDFKPLLYSETVPLSMASFKVLGDGEPIPPAQAFTADYEAFEVGGSWGQPWSTTWFRLNGEVPASWAGKTVAVLFDYTVQTIRDEEGFTAEGLGFWQGKPFAAINRNRNDLRLFKDAQGGESVEVYLEMAANGEDPDFMGKAPDGNYVRFEKEPMSKVTRAALGVWDEDAWLTYRDFHSAVTALEVMPEQSMRRAQLLYGCNEALNAFVPGDRSSLAKVREILRPLMEKKNGDTQCHFSAVGHAHIDTAWLWPIRETIRKCARTFSTQLRYMEEYPEYSFSCSQPIQYAWMKHYYPDIYADIQAAVKRGQWEPVGSMWIEADCNVTSGESLVRQIVHGKRYFMDEFDYETKDMWLPDVFGYAASMPQLLKQSGIDYFMTQKISWSQFNKFPHHTFEWQGIDGTGVFTHFPPCDTYNATLEADLLVPAAERFRDKDRATRAIVPFGWGDGGGGPTRAHLEDARRFEDFEGIPKVTVEKVMDFFPKAEADARDLPVWVGELYLELHRGTLTTQAAVKRSNRECERLLREAELQDALSYSMGIESEAAMAPVDATSIWDVYERPGAAARGGRAGALDRAWKLLLLNQFHDIIPGSSIQRVYDDAKRDYAMIKDLAEQAKAHAAAETVQSVSTGDAAEPALVWNYSPVERAEVVVDGDQGQWLEAPMQGYQVNDLATVALPESVTTVSAQRVGETLVLENGLMRYTLNLHGQIISAIDLDQGRELIDGAANVLHIHDDHPIEWDAWDLDVFYAEKQDTVMADANAELVVDTPEFAKVRVSGAFGKSQFTQEITLRAGSARLDIANVFDWHEDHKVLKAAFPLKLHSPSATYEIQYGHVERPTHRNTSWDMAKFEVCGHHWAHLAEPDYGVALLNDCKYGYCCQGNMLRLTLLNASTFPDPVADRGRHEFTYAFFPHAGTLQQGGVVEEGYRLNHPLAVSKVAPSAEGSLPAQQSLVSVDRSGVLVSALKVAEEGDAVIVRLYEAHGTRGKVKVDLGLDVNQVRRCDLLERPGDSIDFDTQSKCFEIEVKPFEIVTVHCTRV
ncbi:MULTISPECIES: glycoside hydrolase family 38 C-terminal domain-containing protein [unclassified Lentimonas]|uniref:alpha-mannosidase n=1 Tax=unclassified Lentimonas TaxID=2630993 RepID=UPI00132C0E1F|nr:MULTISPECIES: glycoside hydrolase family 38 C-terminal domain-containing protein [unclassified Lentimonas]CAA6679327.1 Alpha-mannosidase (EC [Lentimonas sp. CC4]CAA6686364.1 Alpha-mannosidase (EC [Lentimonas sp. CC6]CAA7076138.1 Alpha-mannosidase (EC [Lentimonas sp. CC4]CAA7170869.1 Alpha-mannosidase (EC [Lentimonas sp. CC21]CAA7181189.1 Alpha-mannosidase (EC [Lentimonas sp. CC8]